MELITSVNQRSAAVPQFSQPNQELGGEIRDKLVFHLGPGQALFSDSFTGVPSSPRKGKW